MTDTITTQQIIWPVLYPGRKPQQLRQYLGDFVLKPVMLCYHRDIVWLANNKLQSPVAQQNLMGPAYRIQAWAWLELRR